MRQIVLDTETTGIGHEQGHRIIEIGCIELIERRMTDRSFHVYLNPEREVDAGAFRVHGLSTEFLQDKPCFRDVADEFLSFIDQSELIIHNAPFDVGFINAELTHWRHPKRLSDYCSVLDTLVLAKQKHPGQRNSLDALCKRYHVDNKNRQLHGALLDAHLLTKVYLSMTGGQGDLFSGTERAGQEKKKQHRSHSALISSAPVIKATSEELIAHEAFVNELLTGSAGA